MLVKAIRINGQLWTENFNNLLTMLNFSNKIDIKLVLHVN